MNRKQTGKISAVRPRTKATKTQGGGSSGFKVRMRDTVLDREMVRVLPNPPFNGLQLFIPWLGDDRAIDHVKWNQEAGVFDAVIIQGHSAQCPEKVITCVLRSDDCADGSTIRLPYVPQPGMWLPIPWRDGQFFEIYAVAFDSKEYLFDVFIEYRKPLRAKPHVRMYLHDLLEDIFTGKCNGIDNYACQVESLSEVLGVNPNLEEEVGLIQQLSKSLKRLCDLRDEASREYERDMDAEPAGKQVSTAA